MQRHYNSAFFVLATLTAALHVLAWSDFPPSIDPINFTLALHTYDITADAPHPPGYPLYVAAGRAAAQLVGNAHAYQLVNLTLLLGAGYALYSLFRALGRPALALTSAILLLSHPLAWAATVIPESYITDTFFSSVLVAFLVIARRSRLALITTCAALLFFLLGLVRSVSTVILLPLATGTALLTAPARPLRRAGAVALVALFAAALAYLLTIHLGGGFDVYRVQSDRVMGTAFRSYSILGGAATTQHFRGILKLCAWLVVLALPTIAVLLLASGVRRPGLLAARPPISILLVGLLWFVPPFSFYILIYYLKPTYHLIYLPVLLVPLAWAIHAALFRNHRRRAWFATAAIVAFQLSFYWFAPPSLPPQLFRLTHGFVARQDNAWNHLLAELRFIPLEGTLLVWNCHPYLPYDALRLLGRPATFAFTNPDRRILPHLQTDIMPETPIPEQFDRAAIIHIRDRSPTVTVVSLDRELDQSVASLLARFDFGPACELDIF